MLKSWPSWVAAAALLVGSGFVVASQWSGPAEDSPIVYEPGEAPPLVVLVIVDTLRRDALTAYAPNAAPTPHIDAFADESTLYTSAMAPSSWTTPSVGSIMTGKLPSQLGLQHELRRLSDEAVLLPEMLRETGMTTAAVVSNKYASTKWGFNQGYDAFDETTIRRRSNITGSEVTDVAISLLDRFSEEPLFLMAHYVDPHVTYNDHDDHRRWEGEYVGPMEAPVTWEVLRDEYRRMGDSDWEHVRAIYDAEVAYTDKHVGRLFDHLRKSGRMDNALVIFTHDHGEEFNDHTSIGHGYSLYEEAIGAPLIVHYPERVTVPSHVSAPVSLMDIVPTTLELSGLPIPDGLEGRTLLGTLDPERPVRAETDRGGNPHRAVRIGDRKFIYRSDRNRRQVFDLAADPHEKDVLSPGPRDRALWAAMEDWPESELTADAEPIDLDAMEREMLEAIGYLDGDE
ncbi:MAG: arylsulfatase A-like enzyme [Myxococcota bacterium]